jgi:hypothetical protein
MASLFQTNGPSGLGRDTNRRSGPVRYDGDGTAPVTRFGSMFSAISTGSPVRNRCAKTPAMAAVECLTSANRIPAFGCRRRGSPAAVRFQSTVYGAMGRRVGRRAPGCARNVPGSTSTRVPPPVLSGAFYGFSARSASRPRAYKHPLAPMTARWLAVPPRTPLYSPPPSRLGTWRDRSAWNDP